MTSQAQVRRLLSLVPYLREHDGVAMTDVAAAFGIVLVLGFVAFRYML